MVRRTRLWALGIPAIAGAAVLGALLPVAAVAAPVISSGALCLRPSQNPNGQLVAPALELAGSGFTPGGAVRVQRGLREHTAVAAADGSFATSLSVIDLADSGVPSVRSLVVSAIDGGGDTPARGASNILRIRVAPLAFSVVPQRASPSTRVRFRFSGFTPGATIHAHYIHGGRVRGNAPMAAAKAPCGTATVRRTQFPMRRPAVGAWRVQFDNAKTYSPTARPRAIANIEVYRTAG